MALSADVDSLRSDLDKAQTTTASATAGMETHTTRMGGVMQGVFQGVGQGIVGLAADALQGTLSYLKDSIAAASDMGETTSKIGVLFGDSSGKLLAWAETADTALGQSKQQALDAAANFATFGKAAGLSGEDLNTFSTGFVGLASDLASFNNTTPEQAIEAIGAALRGESEPLRAYGVLLDDASMRQKALELGLISTTKEALTPQQKVLAAQALIYQQTSAAQGDFARTSGGLANQQRILEAQMTNLKATVGTAFLPIWLTLTSVLNEIAQAVLPPLAEFFQTTLAPVIAEVADVVGNFISAIIDAGINSSETQEALSLFPESLQPVIRFVLQAIDAFMSLSSNVGSFVSTAMGWFGQLGQSVDEDGTGPMSYFGTWINENMPRIQAIIQNILGAIQSFWESHGEQIMSVVNQYLSVVMQMVDTVMKTILDLVTLVLQLMNGEWDAAGTTLQGIVTRLWDTIKAMFSFYLDTIKALITNIDWWSLGSNIMQGIANGIASGAQWILDAARNAAWNAYEAAKRALGISSPSRVTERGIGLPFVQGIAKGIQGEMGKLNVDVNAGLTGLMAGVSLPQMAAVPTSGGRAINISIANTFNGPADASTVELGTQNGVRAALRAAGLM